MVKKGVSVCVCVSERRGEGGSFWRGKLEWLVG